MVAENEGGAQMRRNSYSEMMADGRYGPDDVYIAVMGMTGSGKSSLIATCCPDAADWVGHELESRTTKVQLESLELDGRRVHLIDTPGFDDTNRSDTDVLKDLAYWLGISYERRKIRLSGLIYLHPITHTRMAGTPFKNLRTFKKLVGSGNMSSVALVTTMWDANSGSEEEDRERRLRETPQYWGDMIAEGARPFRHTNDKASAIKIITPLMGKAPTVLNLQKELVDEGKDLNRTEAGKEVNAEMDKQREMLERKIELTKEDMNKALAAKDEKWVQDLALDQEKYQRQIDETKTAQEDMKLNMEKIFIEKEKAYKKSIEEMDQKLKDIEEKRQQREKEYENDREAARLERVKSDEKAAQQEEAINQARNEAEEAHVDKYMAQLTALIATFDKRGQNEDEIKKEYQNAIAKVEQQKEQDILTMKKEMQRLLTERDQVAQRQREHDQAMMMQQVQFRASQAQMWQQPQQQVQYDNNAGAAAGVGAGLGLGMMGAAAAPFLCCVM